MRFPLEHIYTDDRTSHEYQTICSNSIDNAFKRGTITFFILLSSVAMIGPIWILYKHGIGDESTAFHFPYTEENTPANFFANIGYFSICGMCSLLGNSLIEIFALIITDITKVSAALTELEIERFSNELKSGAINRLEHRTKLLRIFHQIHKIDELNSIFISMLVHNK